MREDTAGLWRPYRWSPGRPCGMAALLSTLFLVKMEVQCYLKGREMNAVTVPGIYIIMLTTVTVIMTPTF